MTIKSFIQKLISLYPINCAEIWDPTGYSVKSQQHKKLKGVIFAIDLTNDVLEYAINNDCNLIVTHHPFIFNKTYESEFSNAPYKKTVYQSLKKMQITAFSIHTNYDAAKYGTSYQILKYLKLKNTLFDKDSPKHCAIFENKNTFINLINAFDEIFKFKNAIRTNFEVDDKHIFQKIAILAGSGSIEQINELHKTQNINLFITSDIKWNEWLNYRELNIKILEIPHLVEQVFSWAICEEIKKIYPNEKLYIKNIELPFSNLK